MLKNKSKSILSVPYDPFLQGGVIIGVTFLVSVIAKLVNWSGIIPVDPLLPWSISATFMLFFTLFNSILSLRAEDRNTYVSRSVIAYIGLAICSALMAWGFTGVSIQDAATYKWVFVVLTIGYLVFLSIVGLMRQIVDIAQREDRELDRQKRKSN